MKLAKLFWSSGSLLMNVVIGIYVYLMSNAPVERAARFEYINEHWNMYGGHWKVELLLMTFVTIGALYFALRTHEMSWTMISVGQFVLLLTYPFMLGGYKNTPLEVAEMANEMATIVFIFGNVVLFAGLFLLYLKDGYLKPWLKVVAFSISGFLLVVFLIIYAEIITWSQAMVIAPLANVMYLINAYYGLKIPLAIEPSTGLGAASKT
ncbi:MAG: hypothetical protein AAF554_14355 [Bacteroidota bacterium]